MAKWNFFCGLFQLRARSEDDADDELLSAAVVKSGNKVVTGSQMGVLNLYSWGYFNDCSDRFPGAALNIPCPSLHAGLMAARHRVVGEAYM